MRLRTPLGILEGSPDEIAAVLRRAEHAPAADARTTQLTLALTPAPRLRNAPSNELLQHDYAQDHGLSARTRAAYARSVHEFERVIAPKSFLDAGVEDVREFERRLVEKCRHVQHSGTWRRCRLGHYALQIAAPPTCNPVACPDHERQTEGPLKALAALKHYYDWLLERGLVPSNPVELVMRRHRRNMPQERGTRKYAPTVDEVRGVLAAVHATGTPRDVTIILSLAKWGRRPGHTMLVHARDVHVTLPAYADFAGARDRARRANGGPRTKSIENPVAPIDAEFRAWLTRTYFPWRQSELGLSMDEGPLCPGTRDLGWYSEREIQSEILTPALEHLARVAETVDEARKWREHARVGSRTRITPGTFRHFASTTWRREGIAVDDRKRLRGDVLTDAMARYEHDAPADICAIYRMPLLLTDPAFRDVTA